MKIIKDYHIHSIYSKNDHGKSTPEEDVIKGSEIGLVEMAISDHGPRHYLYGIKKDNIKKLHEEIKELNKKYKNINVLQGIEANMLSYDGDSDIDELVKNNCDIIMGGFHYGVRFKDFKTFYRIYILNSLGKFSIKINKYITKLNTEAVINFMKKNKIKILTHPGEKIPVNIRDVAKAAVEEDVILEINSSHKHLSEEDLKCIKDIDVKLIIGSDAHH
ncbi:MAG: PHP domain-containing protein, partial [Bacillota bacterium]|nr:PHP domain-containing protein [Bacillota bacterium]